MVETPDGSSLHGTLHTGLSREEVAALYGALGWDVRKCSWTDYEVRSSWAELVIESEAPILMHGPAAGVADRAEELLAPLREAGVSFRVECYGPDGELLREFSG